MTDPKQTLRYPEVMAEEGLDDWRFFLDAAARPVQDRQLRQGARARHPDHRGGRGGQPPPRRRAHLPAGRRRPDQPRRRRRDQPRPRPGPADLARSRPSSASRPRRARSRRSSSPSTCPTPTRSQPSGPPCSATTGTQRRPEVVDPGRPQQHAVVPDGPATPPARSSSASTSTSWCRARSPRSGSQAALDAGGTLVSTERASRRSGCSPTGTATRSASAPPRAGSRTEDMRPPSRMLGRLGNGMTVVRATDYRGCMRQDLLVRMRRVG